MLDMPLEEKINSYTVVYYFSFNPSYAGYASGRWADIKIAIYLRLFQSFLCWICLWKSCTGLKSSSRYIVSILLMLDMPLEEISFALNP